MPPAPQFSWRVSAAAVVISSLIACDRGPEPSADAGTAAQPLSTGAAAALGEEEWRELSGEFERVAKTSTGRADIIRRDGKYLLYLTGVRVQADGPLRVYLVGHDAARTTRAVHEASLVYDMAELDNGATQQVIELPSRPDESLKSVVIWQRSFRVNLAVAPLTPVDTSATEKFAPR